VSYTARDSGDFPVRTGVDAEKAHPEELHEEG